MDTTVTTRPDRPVDAPTRRRAGTLLAATGSLATSVALVLGVAADPGALPYVAPPLVIGLVVAVLAWRFGAWSKAVAAVWGVAALAQLPMTPIPAALPRPDSLFDFVPGWLFVLGALTALVGGVLGIVRRDTDGPATIEQRWLGAAGTVLVALVAVSGVASITTDGTLTAEERAGATEIVMVDAAFQPEALELTPGEVRFAVRNEGNVLHTFTIDELGIDETLSPGQEVLVTATVEAGGGDVVFYCRPHSEGSGADRDGMVGRATVAS